MRWAMVASGTRNAAAIWALVRPPTARSVSASCDGGESAGWQHRNRTVNVSSSSATSAPGGGSWANATSSRRVLDASARRASISRLVATAISQPRGFTGTPSSRPLLRGRDQRLLGRLLSEVKAAVAPSDGGEDLGCELPQERLAHNARSAA